MGCGWVGGWRVGGFPQNNATPWLHLASWYLPDFQLCWESKMEPGVATTIFDKIKILPNTMEFSHNKLSNLLQNWFEIEAHFQVFKILINGKFKSHWINIFKSFIPLPLHFHKKKLHTNLIQNSGQHCFLRWISKTSFSQKLVTHPTLLPHSAQLSSQL